MTEETIQDVVLKRLWEHGDFPAMAQTVARVNALASSDDSSARDLAAAILEDYSLTTKVLRVVNSALFAQSVEITTVSRAIVVLGWQPIQSLVLTIALFDQAPAGANVAAVRDRLGASFLGGMLARKIGGSIQGVNPEEAFICALFHSFGEMLVANFLPEKLVEIEERVHGEDLSEDKAVKKVLGGSYADLGAAVAGELNFPQVIVDSMSPKPPRAKRPTAAETTANLAALSFEMSTTLRADDRKANDKVKDMLSSFEKQFGRTKLDAQKLIEESFEEFEKHASAMRLPIKARPVSATSAEPEEREVVRQPPPAVSAEDVEAIFRQGIGDVTTSLVANNSLSDILLVVMETIYRGLAFAGVERAAFLVRDRKTKGLKFRTGLGRLDGAPSWFNVPRDDAGILGIAVDQCRDVHIGRVGEVDKSRALPSALRSRVGRNAFVVVLPIAVDDRPIGTLYIDGEGQLPIGPEHMRQLSVLRDQVVLAIRQSRG